MKTQTLQIRIRRTHDPNVGKHLGDVSVALRGIHARLEVGRENSAELEVYLHLDELGQLAQLLAKYVEEEYGHVGLA